MPMRTEFLAFLCVGLVLSSCSTAAYQPVTTHLEGNMTEREHDEVATPALVADYYPQKEGARETIFHTKDGGTLDSSCVNAYCSQSIAKAHNFTTIGIPDGTYQFAQTNDSKLILVRDANNTKTIGYIAQNYSGDVTRYFDNLKDAQDFEHGGDTARAVGHAAGEVTKDAVVLIIVGGLVVGVVALAAAAAN
jgi:hypothetical protein